MKNSFLILCLITLIFAIGFSCSFKADESCNAYVQKSEVKSDTLVVLWTSAEKAVPFDMIMPFSNYSAELNWFDGVIFIIWGPSNQLIVENKELQEEIKKLMDKGVKFYVCKLCSDKYNNSEKLTELGLTVQYTGEQLSEYMKRGYYHVVSF